MLIQYLTLLIGLIIGAFFWFYRKSFGFWDKHGFPHSEPSIPWGDAKGMMSSKSMAETINDIYKKHSDKPFVGFWMFFKPSLLVRDPELVKKVLVRDFMTFHDRGFNVNEKTDPLTGHLIFMAGSKWKNLRVKLTPTFTSGKMKMIFPIMIECSKQFQKVLEGPAERGEVVEMKDYAARFTTDIISLAAFGLETNSLQNPDADFRIFGKKVFSLSFMASIRFMCQALLPTIHKLFTMRSTPLDVTEFFLRAFKESMEYREKNNIRRNDVMDLLIQLQTKGRLEGDETEKEGSGSKFTFEEAAAQAFVFFAAGFETSSTTMQFALYELAKNPEVQQKVREEIVQVLEKHNGEITYESLSEMQYLNRVVEETLRMYPPLPILQRECNKDYKIEGTELTLPKGIQIIVDCYGLHNDEKYYPNPKKFDPDRFTEEEKSKRPHYVYMPFGEGPRNCIGARFGLMQSRVGLVTLLKNFKFSVSDKTPIPLVFDKTSFILSSEGGMHLKLEKV